MATKPKTTLQKQLDQANALLKKAKTQLATAETNKAQLNTLSTESKAAVVENKAVAAEARAGAEASAALLGGTIVNNKYVPPKQPTPSKIPAVPTAPSTNITVLKSLLSSLGYSKTLIDSSTQYFMSLIAEDLDYDNIVSLYTDSKDYTLKSGTKITSPFYEQYGYLNEGLTQTKSAKDLFNFVEGTKNLIKSYNISSKFAEPASLKKYIANNVTVEKLDERIMAGKIKSINADPKYVDTLRKLGYINFSEDLTDFFLDNEIGQAQLEINRKTASFATEALRRSNAQTGISFNADSLTKNAAMLIGQGRSEAEITKIAREGYETIAEVLQPSVGLSNIFEGTNAANAQTIQTELEAEQFLGLESSRRKKLKELGTNIMNAKTGRVSGNYSSAGMI